MSRKLLTLFFSAFLIVGFFLVKVEKTFAATLLSVPGHSVEKTFSNVSDGSVNFTGASGSVLQFKYWYNDKGNGAGHWMGASIVDQTAGITYYAYNPAVSTSCGNANESTGSNSPQEVDLSGYSFVAYPCSGSNLVLNPAHTYAFQIFRNTGGADTQRLMGEGSASDTATTFIFISNIPADSSTRIDTFTYATSTRIANVTGYWNTHASSTERLSFWQSSSMLGQESYEAVYATTTGAFSFSFEFLGLPTPYNGSTTTAPFVAPYTLHAEIDQVYSDFNPFSGEGTPPLNLAATSTVVSTLTYGLPDYTTSAGLQEYPEYECAITSITGCLKNAGIWLFYPSSDSVERFKSLSDTLAGKFPFAYVYGMNTLRTELFESTQTATTTISLNFKIIPGHATSSLTLLSASLLSNVPYSNTVKTIIGFILWLMAAEYVYYRVIRSHDPNTPQ